MQIGDIVKWTHTKKLTNGYNFSTRKGKVVGIDGNLISVRYKGDVIKLKVSELIGNKKIEINYIGTQKAAMGGGL
jgi:hypothetical protein